MADWIGLKQGVPLRGHGSQRVVNSLAGPYLSQIQILPGLPWKSRREEETSLIVLKGAAQPTIISVACKARLDLGTSSGDPVHTT